MPNSPIGYYGRGWPGVYWWGRWALALAKGLCVSNDFAGARPRATLFGDRACYMLQCQGCCQSSTRSYSFYSFFLIHIHSTSSSFSPVQTHSYPFKLTHTHSYSFKLHSYFSLMFTHTHSYSLKMFTITASPRHARTQSVSHARAHSRSHSLAHSGSACEVVVGAVWGLLPGYICFLIIDSYSSNRCPSSFCESQPTTYGNYLVEWWSKNRTRREG